jgi:hypothetical protein
MGTQEMKYDLVVGTSSDEGAFYTWARSKPKEIRIRSNAQLTALQSSGR